MAPPTATEVRLGRHVVVPGELSAAFLMWASLPLAPHSLARKLGFDNQKHHHCLIPSAHPLPSLGIIEHDR